MDQVPIHSLVSSAYLTYLGGANETLRDQIFGDWKSGLKGQLNDFSFKNFLSSE
jgi:hypothetical protein